MINGKSILKELTPYQQGMQTEEVKEKYNLDKIIKLASNENPYGYSAKVKTIFTEMENEFNIYPDGYTTELRTAIAHKLNVSKEQIIFGGGSDEIIQMISRAFLYPGVNTVIATPTFPQYKHNAMVEGASYKEIPTIDGYHDLDGMLAAIDENTNVVWLCTPNNPTGAHIPKADLYEFMNKCPKHVLVVLDEAYYEYMDPELDHHAIANLSEYPNLILLRTFSKAYGLAGLRIGYGVANENLIAKLEVVRGPFNTATLAQKAALIALDDDQFIDETVQKNQTIKQDLQQFLTNLGWPYYDSQTNFLLISTPINGEDAFQFLLENGFIVRPVNVPGNPNLIRVTIGTDKDMNLFKRALQDLQLHTSKEIQ